MTTAALKMRRHRLKPEFREKERQRDRERKVKKSEEETEEQKKARNENRKQSYSMRAAQQRGLQKVPNVSGATPFVSAENIDAQQKYRLHTLTEYFKVNHVFHNVMPIEEEDAIEPATWQEAVHLQNDGSIGVGVISETTRPKNYIPVDDPQHPFLSGAARFRRKSTPQLFLCGTDYTF